MREVPAHDPSDGRPGFAGEMTLGGERRTAWRATGAENDVAKVSLDASPLPERERFEAWRAFGEGLCDMYPLGDRAPQRPGRAVAWRLGDLVASRMVFPAYRFRRVDATRSGREDLLVLRHFRQGGMRGILDGEPLRMAPGAFHLFDYERPFEGACGLDGERIVVALPHRVVGYDPRRDAAHLRVAADSPSGRLLASCVATLFAEAPHASPRECARLSDAFVGLLRALFFPAAADDAARARVEKTRAEALRRYVDARFADPSISATGVGRAVGASRATVYRVFAPEGGFERAVRDRRLRAALTELSRTEPSRGAVAAVARRWGFEDAAWFARLCRERFGCAPSEVLGVCAWSDVPAGPAPAGAPARQGTPLLRSLYQ